MKVLMVCLGNICRSPIAQGILESKAPQWFVDSAGTSSWHEGERPDSRSILESRAHGIDIDAQRSRPVRKEDFENFDVIFAMDQSNYANLKELAPEEHAYKIRLIMNEAYPGENRAVPDPYTGGQQGFSNVYYMLDEALEQFVKRNS